jgi:hypothetical protein
MGETPPPLPRAIRIRARHGSNWFKYSSTSPRPPVECHAAVLRAARPRTAPALLRRRSGGGCPGQDEPSHPARPALVEPIEAAASGVRKSWRVTTTSASSGTSTAAAAADEEDTLESAADGDSTVTAACESLDPTSCSSLSIERIKERPGGQRIVPLVVASRALHDGRKEESKSWPHYTMSEAVFR